MSIDWTEMQKKILHKSYYYRKQEVLRKNLARRLVRKSIIKRIFKSK